MKAVTDRSLGVALLGCGRIAASHAAAIVAQPALARLAAVIDQDVARAQQLAARFDVPNVLQDLDAALQRDDVDAIVICTPNDCHAPHALQALAARKHVLVEKPMAETAADARRMADAAVAAGRVLALGHTFRHGAVIRHLQDRRAEMGALRAVEVSQCVFWDGPQAPWWRTRTREQGLILSLFAPHALDFVQWAMIDDPARVHVEVARHQHGWQGEDEAMMLLGYPGGRMASVHISYNQRDLVDRKLLLFDRGVARIEHGDWLFWNDELQLGAPPGPGPDSRRMGGRDLTSYFRNQWAEFVAAVRGEPNRSVTHEEGYRLTLTLEKIRRAAIATNPTLEP